MFERLKDKWRKYEKPRGFPCIYPETETPMGLTILSDWPRKDEMIMPPCGVSVLSRIPRPSRCSDEQLGVALGYFYTLKSEELTDRWMYCCRMIDFLAQSGRTGIADKVRNLVLYRHLLEQAMSAQAIDRTNKNERT